LGLALSVLNAEDSVSKGQNRMKNTQAKMRKAGDPYEIWQSADGSWTWEVLKKWQVDDDKPFARWFTFVKTPIVPEGEYGDTYVSDVKQFGHKIEGGRP